MKVLFLDIDGVLNCAASFKPGSSITVLDPDKVALLNLVTSATGAHIVVSSTWRRDSICRGILHTAGVRGDFAREWHTPFDGETRGHEIAEWLGYQEEVVQSYAIIDDDPDMLPSQKSRFVQTSWDFGMQSEHAEHLIALLKE